MAKTKKKESDFKPLTPDSKRRAFRVNMRFYTLLFLIALLLSFLVLHLQQASKVPVHEMGNRI
jgi:hypothetical protein